MATSRDGERHECELLKYQGRHLELNVVGQRRHWRFIVPSASTGTADMVNLQFVLFCPCCGLDLRKDTVGTPAGRPKLEHLLTEGK